MSWASVVTSQKGRYIVAHTDLDGIARSASVKRIWSDARVIIRYSRRQPATMPATLAEALKTYINDMIPAGSEVLFIDLAVDVKNPQAYLEALREFAKSRKVIWTDHHETDAPFLKSLNEIENVIALWFGPSAYEYTLALVQWLGGNPKEAQEYAILCAFGDRDPTIIRYLDESKIAEWQVYSDGMDVLIRRISSQSDPADYEELVNRMALDLRGVLSEAKGLANQIPVPTDYVRMGRVALVREQLHQAWGPKSLERVALKAGTLYAVGVSLNPRDNTYVVRGITYWIAMARDPDAIPLGKLQAFQEWLRAVGKPVYGPPPAPVVSGFPTFQEALREAERLASMIESQIYEPKSVSLVNDRVVAKALARDFHEILDKLTQILETQQKMYEEYLRLKRRQVELLEQAEAEARRRYD